MKINSVFFERLIRDSERLAILRRLSNSDTYLDKEAIASICGEEFLLIDEVDVPDIPLEAIPSFDDTASEDKPELTPKTNSKKSIDHGKMYALADAGWSQKQIAEEMRCAKSSISIILSNRKRGLDK